MAYRFAMITSTLEDEFKKGLEREVPTRYFWGGVELRKNYNVNVLFLRGKIAWTKAFLCNHFDLIYLCSEGALNTFFNITLLKLLKGWHVKFVVLFHSHGGGKGKKIEDLSFLKKIRLRWILISVDKALFFSPLTLNEVVKAKFIKQSKTQIIHWGEDLDFYKINPMTICDEGYWISVGKENRDWATMDMVKKEVGDNFMIVKGGMTLLECLTLVSKARGVVIVPDNKGLTYCTGYTCLMEALAIGKPIISVKNPYFAIDIEKEGCGIYVDAESPMQIVDAIHYLDARDELRMEMSKKAKNLSTIYNMDAYERELVEVFYRLME